MSDGEDCYYERKLGQMTEGRGWGGAVIIPEGMAKEELSAEGH